MFNLKVQYIEQYSIIAGIQGLVGMFESSRLDGSYVGDLLDKKRRQQSPSPWLLEVPLTEATHPGPSGMSEQEAQNTSLVLARKASLELGFSLMSFRRILHPRVAVEKLHRISF